MTGPIDGVTPILVAHGTRSAAGVSTVAAIADLVSIRIGTTRVAFVDVLGPSPSDVLREIDGPAVVVPAFLAVGYHVRRDLPDHITASGHPAVTVTPSLGPDPALAAVLHQRLLDAGWCPGDAVVLAAAGSSDVSACDEVRRAAAQLGELVGASVETGFVTTATPTVPDAVAAARARGAGRVAIAAYLLAPGLFHTRLFDCGADVVTGPLGADAAVADLIVSRFIGASAIASAAR